MTSVLPRWLRSHRWVVACAAVGLAIAAIAALVPTVAGATAALVTADGATLQRLVVAVGPLAPLISIIANVAQAVLAPIPGTAIVYLNGALFGVWGGAVINLVGGVAGAAACFAIARGLLRSRIATWVERHEPPPVIRRLVLTRASGHGDVRDGLTIAAARLIPGAPFDLVSYAAGITRVGWWPFLWGTAAGSAPHALAYALLGATLHVPLWAGFAATVALGGVAAAVQRLVQRLRGPGRLSSPVPAPAVT